MRAGHLNKRITFQKETRSRNPLNFNEPVVAWADHVTVWASVLPNAGRKYYESLQASAEVSGEIRIRYRKDIIPTMRISYEGRTLKIVSIANPQEKNAELIIYYREGLD